MNAISNPFSSLVILTQPPGDRFTPRFPPPRLFAFVGYPIQDGLVVSVREVIEEISSAYASSYGFSDDHGESLVSFDLAQS